MFTSKFINELLIPDCDFIPTCGGRGEHHPRGIVGKIWKLNDPETIRTSSALKSSLTSGDLVLCIGHSGDFFQDYILIEHRDKQLTGRPDVRFGAYGIGDAEEFLTPISECFSILKCGGSVTI